MSAANLDGRSHLATLGLMPTTDPPQETTPITLQDGPAGHIQALSFGHISQHDDQDVFNVTLVTEFADTTLSVKMMASQTLFTTNLTGLT